MKNFKIYFIIFLWIIFIPLTFMINIFGNIIEKLFTYFISVNSSSNNAVSLLHLID